MFFCLLLAFAITGNGTAEEQGTELQRSLTAFGAAFTIGDSLQADNIGYGVGVRTFKFFDPSSPSGFYYGILANAIVHQAGEVVIGDVKIATLGWRGELVPRVMGADASLSPVLGKRIIGNTVQGSGYVGICPAVGFFFCIGPTIDLEIVYEPVINIFTINGSDDVRNKSYNDICLYIVVKSFTEVKKLDW
jgi:hypothetical protein